MIAKLETTPTFVILHKDKEQRKYKHADMGATQYNESTTTVATFAACPDLLHF